MTIDYAILSRLLVDARHKKTWTVREAAQRAGIKPSTLSRIETGFIRNPRPQHVMALVSVYGLDLSEVYVQAGYLPATALPELKEYLQLKHGLSWEQAKAVEKYLDGDEVFLANYTDNLTDLPLPRLIDFFYKEDKVAAFLCSRPNVSFHLVTTTENGQVKDIQDVIRSGFWINGGFFIFKKKIFEYIKPGEELVMEPFQRLIKEGQLATVKYEGFFVSMDTFKEKQTLDDMYSRGETPWEVWKVK